jgi:hypothetical protein
VGIADVDGCWLEGGFAADGGFADEGGFEGRLLGSPGEDGDELDALAARIVNVLAFVSTRTSCPIATCLAAGAAGGADVDGCCVAGCAEGVDEGC